MSPRLGLTFSMLLGASMVAAYYLGAAQTVCP